jgi:hypothetical protein
MVRLSLHPWTPTQESYRRHVSFTYSYPNYIPVEGATVREIVRRLEPYNIVKLYRARPKFVVAGNPKLALKRSAERYLRAMGDLKPLEVGQRILA